MEDITQGMLAICGNSGARNKVAKKIKVWPSVIFQKLRCKSNHKNQVADGKVRKALIRDDVKSELQRRWIFIKHYFLLMKLELEQRSLLFKNPELLGLSRSACATTRRII